MKIIRPTREWTMCSSTEAQDRTAFKEISPFECTPSTYKNHPRDRIADPMKCVKKYRRSAAGGGVMVYENETARSMEDLDLTVSYLTGQVYAHQQSCDEMDRVSLVKTVNFVDDRLRAIQVDITTLMGSITSESSSMTGVVQNKNTDPWNVVRNIQARLIRYNLLSQYMLSDLDSKTFEWKFAHTALTTAVSSYFATFQTDLGHVHVDNQELDEVMSYAALLHVATVVKKREVAVSPSYSSNGQRCGIALDDGEGMSAILGLYRRYVKKGMQYRMSSVRGDDPPPLVNETAITSGNRQYPKYQHVLKIANAIENGNYLLALRLLRPKGDTDKKCHIDSMDDETRWRMMMRCCLAQAVPLIRIGLIRQYNKSFGKQEKVKDSDIAVLLHLPHAEAAMTFCENIGLPTISSMDGGTHDRVVMKAAPISIHDKVCITKVTNPGRSEDEFVFGRQEWLQCSSSQDIKPPKKDPFEGMSSLQRAMMAMKVDDDPNEIELEADEDDHDKSSVDGNGVVVFPPRVLHKLVS